MSEAWLTVQAKGVAPLLVSFPHTGTEHSRDIRSRACVALARAQRRRLVHRPALCDFADELDATTVHTCDLAHGHRRESRSVGRFALSGAGDDRLVPDRTFDGEPLYRDRAAPDARRRSSARQAGYFAPYHAALGRRARASARACIPWWFSTTATPSARRCRGCFHGELPEFNIGTQQRRDSASRSSRRQIESICAARHSPRANGRFKGGWITRTLRQARRGHSRRADGARIAGLPGRPNEQ